jgi:hypothetical protein
MALACLAAPAPAGAKAKKPHAMYWGAWIGSQITGTSPPYDMGAVDKFAEAVGKGLSLVEFSSPFADCTASPCSYYRFPTAQMRAVREYGAIPFFSWGAQTIPWESAGNVAENRPNIRLADVANGTYDGYIRQFAEDAAAWGHPFFLRFNWEMNGNWFPWGKGVSDNSPADFVAAWRHVHDIFESAGASNVTWTWCPFADRRRKYLNLKPYYPGNAYVDWTCLDGYNWGKVAANPHPWRSFDEIFARAYAKVAKIAPKKPMVLGEIASSSAGGSKAKWIRSMMNALPRRYPKIRGLIWFDGYDRGIDWPLENAPRPLTSFSKTVRKPNWLANGFADLGPGKIPLPGKSPGGP